MEAISGLSIRNKAWLTIYEERDEYYSKPEADAVIARLEAEIARYKANIDTTEAATGMCGIYVGLEHQIEVLNADLTRCQESKAAIGDKCLRLEAEVERKDKAIAAVLDLIEQSHGVYGLHLNGDGAPWESLRTGGQFEQWLIDFDEALSGGR